MTGTEARSGASGHMTFVEECLTPFPEEVVGKLPRKIKSTGQTIHLDFVGHAHVTERLLQLDPEWNWEPLALDPDGLPRITIVNNQATLWIRLTVRGVTRLGVGTVSAGKEEVTKELIGDALRNSALRFGIALSLWAKTDLVSELHDSSPPTVVSAEQANELSAMFDKVDVDARPALKHEFLQRWGAKPDELWRSNMDPAKSWLATRVADLVAVESVAPEPVPVDRTREQIAEDHAANVAAQHETTEGDEY